ncbi:MAG: OBG GTPase family GTP-binding protein [Candidatus Woesearchaeota archaeon]
MPEYNSKIKELEDRIANTKYNKKTQHAIGLYKAQIAKLKEKETARSSKKGATDGYAVRKTGDGTVVLLGFPSVGKSTLLNGITNADSEVGSYAFTTLKPIPGLLEYNHAKIQILDMPGIVHGAASGRGRGKEVLACLRTADLILILLDVNHPEHYKAIVKEVRETGVRMNERKPDVKIIKTSKDGIKIGTTVKLKKIDKETMTGILREFKINNADIVVREDIDIDQFIDVIEGNKKYVPSILVINKIDTISKEKLSEIKKKFNPDLCISAGKKEHLDELKDVIFEKLNLIRVYLKEPGEDADMDVPLIMFKNCTIEDVCEKLHRDFVSKFKFARVWGKSAKFPGQKLMLQHNLRDGDVLELHMN